MTIGLLVNSLSRNRLNGEKKNETFLLYVIVDKLVCGIV